MQLFCVGRLIGIIVGVAAPESPFIVLFCTRDRQPGRHPQPQNENHVGLYRGPSILVDGDWTAALTAAKQQGNAHLWHSTECSIDSYEIIPFQLETQTCRYVDGISAAFVELLFLGWQAQEEEQDSSGEYLCESKTIFCRWRRCFFTLKDNERINQKIIERN